MLPVLMQKLVASVPVIEHCRPITVAQGTTGTGVIVASTVAMTEVLASVGVDVGVAVAVAAVTGVLVAVGVSVSAFATKDTCTGIAHWPADVDVGPRQATFAALSVGGLGTVDVAVVVSVKVALPVPEGVMRQSRTVAVPDTESGLMTAG
jgi:hypothetical protein